MALETFPFVNHTPTHAYPKGDSFKFGKGYEFSSSPQLPLQRRFKLKFNALIWYGPTDNTTDAVNNAKNFDEFYARNLTHKKFNYVHPVFGTLIVKFAPDIPFEMPSSLPGANGVTEGFEITLVEQPL